MAMSEYKEVTANSNPNVSVIFYTVQVQDDYTAVWDKTRRILNDLQSELPEECGQITIETDFMKTAGAIYSVSGEGYTNEELESYAERIKSSMSTINGINKVELEGVRDSEVVVNLELDKINQLDLSLEDVMNLLRAQNLEIPSGTVGENESKAKLRVEGYFNSLDDIENIVVAVSQSSGIMTRLKDIADISYDTADDGVRVKTNLEQAVLVSVYFEDGKNIIPIGKSMNEKLISEKHQLPQDLQIEKILFQPQVVENEVGNFITSLLQGIVFVIIVVFLGMGLRNALVVAVAIPLSIFITFSTMRIWDVEIHQISIVALIIALGMLVDNAIVVSDAIQYKLDSGVDRLLACINGTVEVAGPILTSTATTICTFMPLLILGGEIGDYMRSLPIIVVLSLCASYLVALFVTPTLAYMFFKVGKNKNSGFGIITKALGVTMKHRIATIVIVIVTFVASLQLVEHIGLRFFPFAETDMMYIDVNTERNIDLDTTEKLADDIAGIALGFEEITDVSAAIGDGMPRFYDVMFPAFPSTDYAQLLIKVDKSLIGEDKRFSNLTELRDALQVSFNERISSGSARVVRLEQGEPIGNPVSVMVVGENLYELNTAASSLESKLKTIYGTTGVGTDFANKQYEYSVEVDRFKASQRGLNNFDIQNEINLAVSGRHAGQLRLMNSDYDIRLQSNIKKVSELENLSIKSQITGVKYLLKDIAAIRLNPVTPVIKRFDNELFITVYSDVLSGYNATAIQSELMSGFNQTSYPSVEFRTRGEMESIENNFGEVGLTGLIFILMIYGILLIQFKSFRRPLIILLTIPLAIIGSLIGLYITGISLSFTAFLGMVSLAGIVVNNAIILIDYIDESQKSGSDIKSACMTAAHRRSRPIMLSTATTVIGLIPLILMGSDLFTPMAISLMFGLMISTLLTLIVIPIVTSIIIRDKKKSDKASTSHAEDQVYI